MAVEFNLVSEAYQDKVYIPGSVLIFSARAGSPDELDRETGGKLSELTIEQGIELPKGTYVDRRMIRHIGPITIKRFPAETRVLIP